MLTSSEPFEYFILFLFFLYKIAEERLLVTLEWSVWPIKKTEEISPVINNIHMSMGMSRSILIYSL